IKAFTGRGERIGWSESDTGQYDKIYKTDLGHGAALIVSRKVVGEVGLMPEVYFLYYEEHDWCEQVKRKGYDMYYVGTSRVIHKESVSTGGDESYLKVHYLHRNRLLFMRRNFHGFPYFVGVVFLFLFSIPKKTIFYLRKGKLTLIKALFNGIAWNFTNPKIENT
ncbi:MAG: glycosyltransferase family 2 protein, partial [Cyclobacteriaceae bacterium]